jgi:hypothetical protein
MEKICRTCNLELPIDNFYRNTTYRDGRYNDCVPCYNIKKREYNKNRYNEPVKKNNDDSPYLQLRGVNKEDYETMYRFFNSIGYNIEGDIHQQFIDRHNIKTYKQRKKRELNKYLADGSLNPEYGRFNN